MLQSIILGSGFAFAAAVQPGPLQAFLLSRAASEGWKRTLPAALSPLISDGPIALVALLVLGQLPVVAQRCLRIAGGLLLFYLAWRAFQQWRRPSPTGPDSVGAGPRTLFQAALVNLLNPNPYLGWTLVLGPAVVSAWRRDPANAMVLLAAFYGTMVASLAVFIVLAGTARFLGQRLQRALILISAAILGALGVLQVIIGVQGHGA